MIKYNLTCKDCETSFDSWFSSSKEYERLKKISFLNCYSCNSLNIEKSLMSPNIFKSKNSIKIEKKYTNIKKKLSEYQRFITKNFDYVGENFAYQARSIHYKNKKLPRGIYGSATKDELKELKEEGIEVEVMPQIKDTTN